MGSSSQRYEDAVSKLEQLEGLCDPCLMENNQHLEKMKSIFKQFRDDKENDRCKRRIDELSEECCNEKNNSLVDHSNHDSDAFQSVSNKQDFYMENQVIKLQTQLQQEKIKTAALETQIQKMLVDLQEKLDLEAELENLNHRLKKECVPRVEMEHLKANQEMAIGRIRQQAILESEAKLNAKVAEVNKFLQLQLQEQVQRERHRDTLEAQMKQEFQNDRQKLLLELSRVQAALCAKESEEKLLRTRCEALRKEVEQSRELAHQLLIEKSYSVNLTDTNVRQEKDVTLKQCVAPPPPPIPAHTPAPLELDMFSAESLRQQLEQSISKHRDVQLNLDGEDIVPSPHGQ